MRRKVRLCLQPRMCSMLGVPGRFACESFCPRVVSPVGCFALGRFALGRFAREVFHPSLVNRFALTSSTRTRAKIVDTYCDVFLHLYEGIYWVGELVTYAYDDLY